MKDDRVLIFDFRGLILEIEFLDNSRNRITELLRTEWKAVIIKEVKIN